MVNTDDKHFSCSFLIKKINSPGEGSSLTSEQSQSSSVLMYTTLYSDDTNITCAWDERVGYMSCKVGI